MSKEILKMFILDINLNITNLRIAASLRANELRYFWVCSPGPAGHERQSSLDVQRPHAVSTIWTISITYNIVFGSGMLMKTSQILDECLLKWQKYLKYMDKHQVLLPSSRSTKYLCFSKGWRQVYQVLDILHQVPSTNILLNPNPDLIPDILANLHCKMC